MDTSKGVVCTCRTYGDKLLPGRAVCVNLWMAEWSGQAADSFRALTCPVLEGLAAEKPQRPAPCR